MIFECNINTNLEINNLMDLHKLKLEISEFYSLIFSNLINDNTKVAIISFIFKFSFHIMIIKVCLLIFNYIISFRSLSDNNSIV